MSAKTTFQSQNNLPESERPGRVVFPEELFSGRVVYLNETALQQVKRFQELCTPEGLRATALSASKSTSLTAKLPRGIIAKVN
ncbi:MAG: hypothetical protein L3J66_04530 [Bacteroidales bacterium]|nr:hypothetical protein [Bacteroidales bacterium]